jgi:Domain of unknown function (DUF4440)
MVSDYIYARAGKLSLGKLHSGIVVEYSTTAPLFVENIYRLRTSRHNRPDKMKTTHCSAVTVIQSRLALAASLALCVGIMSLVQAQASATTTTASAPATKASVAAPPTPLPNRVRAFDTAFFNAFNTCDMATLERMVSPDLEFFHDLAGTSRTSSAFLASVKANVCGKFSRALVPKTFEAWPLGKEGAIYSGSHQFCHAGKIGCQGEGRFLHVLEEHKGQLRLLRVVSYDHREIAVAPVSAGR